MIWKCCTQYASKFGKLGIGHRIGKCQYSFQSQRRAMPRNCTHLTHQQSNAQNSPSQANSMWTVNSQYINHELPYVQDGFRKGRGNQRSNCQHLLDHWKSKRVPGKHLLLLYWLCQSLWLCGSQQTVENSSRDGNTKTPYLPPEKSQVKFKKQQLELDMEQKTGSKSGNAECIF